MARYLYCNADPAKITIAQQLGFGYCPAVPDDLANAATAPCAIVAGAGQAAVFPDTGNLNAATILSNATVQAIVTAEQNAQTAASNTASNAATIQTALTTRLGQIESWLAANPNGATLTAAQTLIVGKMLAQLARLLLQMTSSVGQAN